MSRLLLVPLALCLAGVALIVYAVVAGAATASLVVFVPVISGASAAFLAGVVLLLIGFVALPLAFGAGYAHRWIEVDDGPIPGNAPPEEVGGLILIGPLPIFFGSTRHWSTRAKIAVSAVGGMLLVILVYFAIVR